MPTNSVPTSARRVPLRLQGNLMFGAASIYAFQHQQFAVDVDRLRGLVARFSTIEKEVSAKASRMLDYSSITRGLERLEDIPDSMELDGDIVSMDGDEWLEETFALQACMRT